MPRQPDTCWTLLRAATDGDADARSLFARCYLEPIRDYLAYRWRTSMLSSDVDDAAQEVFLECLRPDGALERADPARGSFRSLLYGIVRNTARRFEERQALIGRHRGAESVYLDDLPAQAESLSRYFDRAWARSVLREAAARHAADAEAQGGDCYQRFRVLQMRHEQSLPVRAIAAALGETDVESVHNDYRRARREFRRFLRDVVAMRTGATGDAVDDECRLLIELFGS